MIKLCGESEQQIQDGQKDLENALQKIEMLEKIASGGEKKLEEVRKELIKIAELFEKKKITANYSFEVLCDFIFDKSNRLFRKYENSLSELSLYKENK